MKKLFRTAYRAVWYRYIILPVAALLALSDCSFGQQADDENLRSFAPERQIISIPANIARIEQIRYGSNNKTVVLIRDIHGNSGAQYNTAQLLEYLHDQYSLNTCAVEGFSGTMDLSFFAAFTDQEIRKSVAMKSLKKGIISGEEYLNIVSPNTISLIGLEDKALYFEHLNLFRTIIKQRAHLMEQIDDARATLSAAATQSGYGELLGSFMDVLDLKKEPYDFIAQLDEKFLIDPPDAKRYPALYRSLIGRMHCEELDYDRLGSEIDRITALLKEAMPASLKRSFEAFEKLSYTGSVAHDNYYTVIADLLYGTSHTIDEFPQFKQYIDYVSGQRAVDSHDAIEQMYRFAAAYTPDPSLHTLFDAAWACGTLRELLECALSPTQAASLCAGADEIYTHYAAMLAPFINSESDTDFSYAMDAIMPDIIRYYTIAFKRDNVLASNLERNAVEPMCAAITGGFHSPGMTTLLQQAGYTVIVVSPLMNGSHEYDNYLDIITNKLDDTARLFALRSSTLRQPGLVWRPEHAGALQLDCLTAAIAGFSGYRQTLYRLDAMIMQSGESESEHALLASTDLYTDGFVIYLDFNHHGITVVIRFDGNGRPEPSVVQGETRIPAGLTYMPPASVQAAQLDTFIDLIYSIPADTQVDIEKPSGDFFTLIEQYTLFTQRQQLDGEELGLLRDAIVERAEFNGTPYNLALTDLFMKLFQGNTNPPFAAAVLEALFRRNNDAAHLIVRSTGEGKHFQMGDILFGINEYIRDDLIMERLVDVPDEQIKDFHQLDRFVAAGVLSARYSVLTARSADDSELRETIRSFDTPERKILLMHLYQFYFLEPSFASTVKKFVGFLGELFAQEEVSLLFDAGITRENKVLQWLDEITASNALSDDELEAILKQHPNFEYLQSLRISFENIDTALRETSSLIDSARTLYPEASEHVQFIAAHIVQARDSFRNNNIDQGMLAWGNAADRLDALLQLNRAFSTNADLRVAEYMEHRIDRLFADHILVNGLSGFKSILPHHRPRVTARLKFIPSDSGLSLLLDNGLLDDGFAVVDQYPVNDPSLAKPRAIIAEQGMGRREHAAKLAQHWNIPYVVIPHARTLLRELAGSENNERWITLELGKHPQDTRLYRATQTDIEAEQAYRDTQVTISTEETTYVPPTLDLSVVTPRSLDQISLNDKNAFGIKTARLGYMKQNGVPVVDGFGVPFGFFDMLLDMYDADGKTVRAKIEQFLAQPDFSDKSEYYLDQIRSLITGITLPPASIESLTALLHELDPEGKGVIVRSSMSDEDRPGFFTAGLYDSFPNVTSPQQLIEAILNSYASLWSARAFRQRIANETDHLSVYPSVLIQNMIDAEYSGVIETMNMLTGNTDQSGFSIAPGHGGAVDGVAAEFMLDTRTGLLDEAETDIPYSLKDTVVARIPIEMFTEMDTEARSVAKLYGVAQNIEFARDKNGLFWVTQSQDMSAAPVVQQPDEISDAPLVTKQTIETVSTQQILREHHGIFSYLAHRIQDITDASSSEVTISTEQGHNARGNNVLDLITLGAVKNGNLSITATGPDAAAVVEQIKSQLSTPLFPQEIYADEPEFLIFTVRGKRGLHSRPSDYINDLIRASAGAVAIFPATALDADLPADATVPARNLKLSANKYDQSTRLQIKPLKATGFRLMKTLHFYGLYDNLGDPGDPDSTRSDYTIPIAEVIQKGDLLETREKSAIDRIVHLISDNFVYTATDITVDTEYATVTAMALDGSSHTVQLPADDAALLRSALRRDPHTEDYLLLSVHEQIPAADIVIDSAPKEIQPVIVKKELKLSTYDRISSAVAHQLADIANKYKAHITIHKDEYTERGAQRYSKVTGDIRNPSEVVNLRIRRTDSVFLSAQGEDAQAALDELSDLLSTTYDPSSFFKEPPQFLMANFWTNEQHNYKEILQCAKKFNAEITMQILRPDNSNAPRMFTVSHVIPNLAEAVENDLMGKGTTFRLTATGPEATQALAHLQYFIIHSQIGRNPTNRRLLEMDIAEGSWLIAEEIEAFEALIDAMRSIPPDTETVIDLPKRQIGYTDSAGDFHRISIPVALENIIYYALQREPYAEDYLIFNVAEFFEGKSIVVQRNEPKSAASKKIVRKMIDVSEQPGIYAFVAHEIADIARGFNATITLGNEAGQRADVHDIAGVSALDITRDDALLIEADGPDAVAAVALIEAALSNPLLERQNLSESAEFLVLAAASGVGLPGQPISRMAELARRYPDTHFILSDLNARTPPAAPEAQGLLEHNVHAEHGMRLWIKGPHADAARWDMRRLALYNNFGLATDDRDLEIHALVSEGLLLTNTERDCMNAIINVIAEQLPADTHAAHINVIGNDIMYRNAEAEYVSIEVPGSLKQTVIAALMREPYAEDYLLRQGIQHKSKITINVMYPPQKADTSDKPVLVEQVYMIEQELITAYHAHKMAEIVEQSSSTAIISDQRGHETAVTDVLGMVNAMFERKSFLTLQVSGPDAAEVMRSLMQTINNRINPMDRFRKAPSFLKFYARNKFGLHWRATNRWVEQAKKFPDTKIDLEQLVKQPSPQLFPASPVSPNVTLFSNGYSYRVQGTSYKMAAFGPDRFEALVALQDYALVGMFGEAPALSGEDIPLSTVIRAGELMEQDELDTLSVVMGRLEELKPYNTQFVEFSVFSSEIGYRLADDSFTPLEADTQTINAFYDILLREPYTEDYILYHLYERLPGYDIRFIYDEYSPYARMKTLRKNVYVAQYPGIYAHRAHIIVDAVRNSSSRIKLVNNKGEFVYADNLQDLVNFDIGSVGSVIIEALGSDAAEVLPRIKQLLTMDIPLKEIYPDHPTFLILFPRNYQGIHYRPMHRFNDLAKSFNAQTTMEMLHKEQDEDGRYMDRVIHRWHNINDAELDSVISTGARLRLRSDGPEAVQCMAALQQFVNLNNTGESNSGPYDMAYRTMIKSGVLLSMEEYAVMEEVLKIINHIISKNIDHILISRYDRRIGLVKTDGSFIPLQLSSQYIDLFFGALDREPHAEDTLLTKGREMIPDMTIDVLLDTSIEQAFDRIAQPLVAHGITILNGMGVHHAVAGTISRTMETYPDTHVMFLNKRNNDGRSPLARAHEMFSILEMKLRRYDYIVIAAQREQAEEAVTVLIDLFNAYLGDERHPLLDLPQHLNKPFIMTIEQNTEPAPAESKHLNSFSLFEQSL